MFKELEEQNSQNREHELLKNGSDLLINLCDFIIQRKHKYKSSPEIVFEVKNKDNGNLYLARVLEISKNDDISQKITKISYSINILTKLNHPCLLKHIGYSPNDFDNNLNPIIVTEYAIKNRLNDFIMQNGHSIKYFNDTLKLICIYGIASAISYLHSNNIIYDDLKPSDVFFDKFFIPKISSLAIKLLNNEQQEENHCIINNSHNETNSSKNPMFIHLELLYMK